MSEKITHSYENGPESNTNVSKEIVREKHDNSNERGENNATKIESLSLSAKHEAISNAETHIDKSADNTPSPVVIQKHHKKHAYKQTLKSVRRQLPVADRAFSYIIHQPVIEKISDISSKTIARPSGLLSAGVVALLGNIILLYMSRHFGFRYNYFVFTALLVLGYTLGIFIEILSKVFSKNRNIN